MVRSITAAALLLAAPAAAQSQAEMTRDAGAAFTKADAAMTAQWRTSYAAMKRKDAANPSRGGGFGYAASLLESQRAWLKFRDTQCVVEGGRYAGGSMQPMAQAQCRARLTDERTAQLRDAVRADG